MTVNRGLLFIGIAALFTAAQLVALDIGAPRLAVLFGVAGLLFSLLAVRAALLLHRDRENRP